MNKLLFFVLVVCLCKSIDAVCPRCGEPWTRGPCETCACAASLSCNGCPAISDCGCTNINKCSCMDPECQCLKAKARFPDVEYPMSISEMKHAAFGGCCI